MRPLLPALLALAACGPGQQPAAPTRELPPATDTIALAEPEVGGGVWLGGDRWAVLTPFSKGIQLLDFTTRGHRPLGRAGVDYLEPYLAFRVADTLYVGDWGKRRLTLWTLEGKLVRSVEAANALRGTLPRGRDGAGRWYAELRPLPGSDGSGNLDSGAVVRWTEGAPSVDTVVMLAPYNMERVSRDGATRYERVVFGGIDQWGVHPDGSVWVARARNNRLEQCGPARGGCTAGPELPDRVLEVTLQDREYFLQGYPVEQRTLARTIPFSITKPPFERAFAGQDSLVYFEKSRDLTDTTRGYQELSASGVAKVELRVPNAQRILAIDGGQALTIDPVVPGPGHRVLRYRLR
jgi:hypothetical protein